MGRFSGGTASRWKSRSEINVRTLAAATVAITNSPCHQDRDSFGTISRTDIMRSEAHRQTLLITPRQMIASRTEKFLNPTQICSAWLRRWGSRTAPSPPYRNYYRYRTLVRWLHKMYRSLRRYSDWIRCSIRSGVIRASRNSPPQPHRENQHQQTPGAMEKSELHHSLNSPVCSCVSITLPAAS